MNAKHKWIPLTEEEHARSAGHFGGQAGFFRRCTKCGWFRRITAIRRERMYSVDGSWTMVQGTAPKCREELK